MGRNEKKLLKKLLLRTINHFKLEFLRYVSIIVGDNKVGVTFNRVLIILNEKLISFLKTENYSYLKASEAKIYLDITRNRNSVAILYDGMCLVDRINKFTIK